MCVCVCACVRRPGALLTIVAASLHPCHAAKLRPPITLPAHALLCAQRAVTAQGPSQRVLSKRKLAASSALHHASRLDASRRLAQNRWDWWGRWHRRHLARAPPQRKPPSGHRPNGHLFDGRRRAATTSKLRRAECACTCLHTCRRLRASPRTRVAVYAPPHSDGYDRGAGCDGAR